MSPDRLFHERELASRQIVRIAGVDEAGRGPLAGPVVAAAVILPALWFTQGMPTELVGLNDSKQLTESQRERYFEILVNHPSIHSAIAAADAATIDAINILQASHRAMNQAIAQLAPPPHHVLVDGLRVKSITFPQTPIIQGDCLSYSIAAASVLAKVTRDRLMVEFDAQWPLYGFRFHKGYPTPKHLEIIAQVGPCPIHRRSFAPVRQQYLDFNEC